MSDEPELRTPTVWQEADGWHVRVHQDGVVKVFATRDEAISFSTSAFTDGPTSSRAQTQRGEVTMPTDPQIDRSASR